MAYYDDLCGYGKYIILWFCLKKMHTTFDKLWNHLCFKNRVLYFKYQENIWIRSTRSIRYNPFNELQYVWLISSLTVPLVKKALQI